MTGIKISCEKEKLEEKFWLHFFVIIDGICLMRLRHSRIWCATGSTDLIHTKFWSNHIRFLNKTIYLIKNSNKKNCVNNTKNVVYYSIPWKTLRYTIKRAIISLGGGGRKLMKIITVCPGSSDPFYIVSYYIK